MSLFSEQVIERTLSCHSIEAEYPAAKCFSGDSRCHQPMLGEQKSLDRVSKLGQAPFELLKLLVSLAQTGASPGFETTSNA